jgi:queuine/archaeosine tRNA-ribosyltransferase
MYVPIVNDSYHAHLTKEDWELLSFSHVAIDVINLFLHSYYVIPSTAKVVFLDIRIRSCHKISRQKNLPDTFFLYSPHNGQKIIITPEDMGKMLNRFSNISGVEIVYDLAQLNKYDITDRAAKDAVNGILYSKTDGISISDLQCADQIKPIEVNCECYTCKNYTLSYLHHLHNVGVPLGTRLGILHNLHYSRSL